jgi:alpha-1,2-mannosyltransferase
VSLLAVRLLSAAVNTVHDCDEVFNYWEPLHHLVHGYGLQTWENRCRASRVRRRGAAT